MDYQSFLAGKHVRHQPSGFEISKERICAAAFPFQRDIIQWALRLGRAALFADCGLGKTLMQLEWGSHVAWHTQRPVLLLCPIAVAEQTLSEHAKFGIQCQCRIVSDQSEVGPGINICNYEKLHKLRAELFGGVILDESSILKAFTGKTRNALVEAFAQTPYRLCCTATPAPNDHDELGNHAEFLGVMQLSVMRATWFTHDGGDTSKWRIRKHGTREFWRWVASWAVCIGKPSDLGYSDEGYALPDLGVSEHVIRQPAAAGALFNTGVRVSATNVHEEKRASLAGKASEIAALVNGDPDQWVIWVDTNYEADAILAAVPDAVEVRGSMPDTVKSERLSSFSRTGGPRVLVTKPEIGGFGLNWQHCHKTTCMASFSFERWYQLIRRFLRFGQKHPVECHLMLGENEQSVRDAMQRKSRDFELMRSEMIEQMREGMLSGLRHRSSLEAYTPTAPMAVPAWMK